MEISRKGETYTKKNSVLIFPFKVNDYDDSEYVGNITIGTPGQAFEVR